LIGRFTAARHDRIDRVLGLTLLLGRALAVACRWQHELVLEAT